MVSGITSRRATIFPLSSSEYSRGTITVLADGAVMIALALEVVGVACILVKFRNLDSRYGR